MGANNFQDAGFKNLNSILVRQVEDLAVLIGNIVDILDDFLKKFILGVAGDIKEGVQPLLQALIDYKFITIFEEGVDFLGESRERIQGFVHLHEALQFVTCLIVLP